MESHDLQYHARKEHGSAWHVLMSGLVVP